MAEKDTIYKTKLKAKDCLFDYGDYYKFCYNWLMQEIGMNAFSEKTYSEKISGENKDIDIKWEGYKNLTDYFRMEVKIVFKVLKLKKVEAVKNGVKVNTNQAMSNELEVKGTLVRDYQGKFEKSALTKFWRGIYERWIISERIDQMENKVFSDLDEFVGQVKAYLALEGNTAS
jgi:hypothetical protein